MNQATLSLHHSKLGSNLSICFKLHEAPVGLDLLLEVNSSQMEKSKITKNYYTVTPIHRMWFHKAGLLNYMDTFTVKPRIQTYFGFHSSAIFRQHSCPSRSMLS